MVVSDSDRLACSSGQERHKDNLMCFQALQPHLTQEEGNSLFVSSKEILFLKTLDLFPLALMLKMLVSYHSTLFRFYST